MMMMIVMMTMLVSYSKSQSNENNDGYICACIMNNNSLASFCSFSLHSGDDAIALLSGVSDGLVLVSLLGGYCEGDRVSLGPGGTYPLVSEATAIPNVAGNRHPELNVRDCAPASLEQRDGGRGKGGKREGKRYWRERNKIRMQSKRLNISS